MSQSITRLLLFLVTGIPVLFGYNSVWGQVSAGTTEKAAKAALIQLKTHEADNNNTTTDKGGLLLPRVKLIDRKTLEPFIANDLKFQNNEDKVKDLHTGLTVFNLYISAEETIPPTDTDKIFHKGIYVWDGTQWIRTGSGGHQAKWFYPPAFNLPLPVTDKDTDPVRTFDLYGEYKRQFTKNTVNNPAFVDTQGKITSSVPSPLDGRLYLPDELDFVITYFDTDIIRDVAVSPSGVLSYRVSDNDPGCLSFLNLVFVVKE